MTLTDYSDVYYDDAMEIADLFHAESKYRSWSLNKVKIYQILQGSIVSPDIFVKLAVKDGEVIGVAIAVAIEHWFSSDKYGADLCVYVKPEYRKGRVGIKLIEAMKEWAANNELKNLTLGNTAGIIDDSYADLLERLGFDKVGLLVEKEF